MTIAPHTSVATPLPLRAKRVVGMGRGGGATLQAPPPGSCLALATLPATLRVGGGKDCGEAA
jgi:hypothetical protein